MQNAVLYELQILYEIRTKSIELFYIIFVHYLLLSILCIHFYFYFFIYLSHFLIFK